MLHSALATLSLLVSLAAFTPPGLLLGRFEVIKPMMGPDRTFTFRDGSALAISVAHPHAVSERVRPPDFLLEFAQTQTALVIFFVVCAVRNGLAVLTHHLSWLIPNRRVTTGGASLSVPSPPPRLALSVAVAL
jgi:hypothetical protein